jgi:hypothetical protein
MVFRLKAALAPLQRLARLIVSMPEQFLRHLFEQAIAHGSRSTALKPLGWLLGILIFGLLGAPRAGLGMWVIVGFAIFTALAAFLYLGAYVYFMCKDRDALRSER